MEVSGAGLICFDASKIACGADERSVRALWKYDRPGSRFVREWAKLS